MRLTKPNIQDSKPFSKRGAKTNAALNPARKHRFPGTPSPSEKENPPGALNQDTV